MAPTAPTFDGPAFARWLRRWKEAEGLGWRDIAERSGIAIGTIQLLARGKPPKIALARGQTEISPGINTLARLADGLGLDLSYVLSKGGIAPGGHDRWDGFSNSERTLLHSALRSPTFDVGVGGWEQDRNELVQQLETTLTEEVTA